MSQPQTALRSFLIVLGVLAVTAVVGAVWWFVQDRESWPRGEALGTALRPSLEQQKTDQSLVARVIWENYVDTPAVNKDRAHPVISKKRYKNMNRIDSITLPNAT